MARRTRRSRNTAPLWKKAAIVLSAPAALAIVMSVLDTRDMNFFVFAGLTLVLVVAVVWLMSRLLGVHVGLRSWD